MLLQEYDIESAQDIQDALKDLLGGTIKEMMEAEIDDHLGYCFHDLGTKTDAGIRDIPMTQMVYDVLRKQRELNLMPGLQSNVEIGGRSGFIFNTKHEHPIMPAGVNSFLKNSVNAYNKKVNWQKMRSERQS